MAQVAQEARVLSEIHSAILNSLRDATNATFGRSSPTLTPVFIKRSELSWKSVMQHSASMLSPKDRLRQWPCARSNGTFVAIYHVDSQVLECAYVRDNGDVLVAVSTSQPLHLVRYLASSEYRYTPMIDPIGDV